MISAETIHTACEPNMAAKELALRLNTLRENVVSTQDSVKNIYENIVSTYENTGMGIVQKVPKYVSKKSNLYKIRNKTSGVTKMHFKNVKEVEVPKIYQDFVLSEFNDNTIRVIVFCAPEIERAESE